MQHNKKTDSGEAVIAAKTSKPSSSELKLPLPFQPALLTFQTSEKRIFLLSSRQTLTQLGKSDMQASTWSFPVRTIWRKKQHSQEVLAEFYSLTRMAFFPTSNSLIMSSCVGTSPSCKVARQGTPQHHYSKVCQIEEHELSEV